jgi:pimeloyl-ACP methyl ester carboxylesterase
MPNVKANGIEICYETSGDRNKPAMILVMGLGGQLTMWPDEFCRQLADRGYFVIRYDNRDVGLSTKFEGMRVDLVMPSKPGQRASIAGKPPYTLSDTANDGFGLLDALNIGQAHIVGASLGGMIVQRMALEHPQRVLSMTSIMSTTGNPQVGLGKPEAMAALFIPAPSEREANIEHSVKVGRLIGGPLFDEKRTRQQAGERFDRSFYPAGVARQMAAALADGDRTTVLASIKCPALVIHGRADPLMGLSGGEATAKAIPGAKLVVLDQMGHDLPEPLWPELVSHITAVAASN